MHTAKKDEEKGLSVEQAKKADAHKAPLGLIPRAALLEEAEVLAFGAAKYDVNNWRKGVAWTRMSNAALRHIVAWIDGEDFDDESKLHHLAHARCCLGFLLEYAISHPELDDRYRPTATAPSEPAIVPPLVFIETEPKGPMHPPWASEPKGPMHPPWASENRVTS